MSIRPGWLRCSDTLRNFSRTRSGALVPRAESILLRCGLDVLTSPCRMARQTPALRARRQTATLPSPKGPWKLLHRTPVPPAERDRWLCRQVHELEPQCQYSNRQWCWVALENMRKRSEPRCASTVSIRTDPCAAPRVRLCPRLCGCGTCALMRACDSHSQICRKPLRLRPR